MSSLANRRAKAGAGHANPTTATDAFNRMNERPRDIRLADVTLDLGLQFRLDVKGKDGIDEKHVLDLMHVIADGADTDPVILYRVDNALLMVDGFHRYEAYRRCERKTIPAIVRDGTYPEAEEAAENANLQFKKALGDESKKYIFARRVQRGYQTNGISWNNLSDKAIAAELGVSYQAINNWFSELISGVNFLTPAGQEISIQLDLDRSVVYGRDGKRYEVQAMRDVMTKRAAEAAERRAIEEAERKRNLPAIDKLRVICDMLVAKYGKRQAEKGQPFSNDPAKGFKWCQQVSNPTFVTGTDWEIQFLKEYHAKSVGLYQEFLRLTDQATFIEAEMDSWTDDQLADWVYAMRQQPRAGYGMAQPKNVGATFEQGKPIGRHPAGTASTVAATEPATEKYTGPRPPCPFQIGHNVQVAETGERGIVQATEYIDHQWVIRVELYDGLRTFGIDEINRVFTSETPSTSETPTKLTRYLFKTGDRVRIINETNFVGKEDTIAELTTMAGQRAYFLENIRIMKFYERDLELASGDATPTEPSLDDAPFSIGQELWVVETGEMDTVIKIRYEDDEWRIWLENSEDFNRVDELSPASRFGSVATTAAEQSDEEINTYPVCPFTVGDRVILKRNPKPVSVVKTVKQLKDGTWQLTMTNEHGYEFYEVPANLAFAPPESDSGAVVIEDEAIMPFRTGDIVRDIQSGTIAEVIGWGTDGILRLESDDLDGGTYQYDAWAYDFEKYTLDAKPAPKTRPSSNGNRRQSEVMVEDARSIIPRLVLDTTNATVDYRTGTLVRWEAWKSIQTILDNGDPNEINLLARDLRRLQGEGNLAVKLLDQMLGNVDAMLSEIEVVRAQ